MVVLLASVLVYCTAAVLQSLSQAREGQNLLGGGGFRKTGQGSTEDGQGNSASAAGS